MSVALRIESGSLSSKAIGLPLGQTIRVGREHPSDLVVGDDGMMSRVHFEIAFDGKSIWLHDLRSTNGTFLNRNPVFQAELRGNDEIRAGRTVFRVVVEADAPAEETSQKQDAAPITFNRLLGLMRGELQPLYAVLDAARDPEIFRLLSHSEQPYYWLFEGEESAKLSLFAPYLVPLEVVS